MWFRNQWKILPFLLLNLSRWIQTHNIKRQLRWYKRQWIQSQKSINNGLPFGVRVWGGQFFTGRRIVTLKNSPIQHYICKFLYQDTFVYHYCVKCKVWYLLNFCFCCWYLFIVIYFWFQNIDLHLTETMVSSLRFNMWYDKLQ